MSKFWADTALAFLSAGSAGVSNFVKNLTEEDGAMSFLDELRFLKHCFYFSIAFAITIAIIAFFSIFDINKKSQKCIPSTDGFATKAFLFDLSSGAAFGSKPNGTCMINGNQRKELDPAYCTIGQSKDWVYTGYKTLGGPIKALVTGKWYPFGSQNTAVEDTFVYKPLSDVAMQGNKVVYTFQESKEPLLCDFSTDAMGEDTIAAKINAINRFKTNKTNISNVSMDKFVSYEKNFHLKDGVVNEYRKDYLECALDRGYGIFFLIEGTDKAFHMVNHLVSTYVEYCDSNKKKCSKALIFDDDGYEVKMQIPFTYPLRVPGPSKIDTSKFEDIFGSKQSARLLPIDIDYFTEITKDSGKLMDNFVFKMPPEDKKIYVNSMNTDYSNQDGIIEILFLSGAYRDVDYTLGPRFGLENIQEKVYDILEFLIGKQGKIGLGKIVNINQKNGGFFIKMRESMLTNETFQAIKVILFVTWMIFYGYKVFIASTDTINLQNVGIKIGGGAFVNWTTNSSSFEFFDEMLYPFLSTAIDMMFRMINDNISYVTTFIIDTKNPYESLDLFLGYIYSDRFVKKISGIIFHKTYILVYLIVSPMMFGAILKITAKSIRFIVLFATSIVQIGLLVVLFPILMLCLLLPKHDAVFEVLAGVFKDIFIGLAKDAALIGIFFSIPVYFFGKLLAYEVCYESIFEWNLNLFGFDLISISMKIWVAQSLDVFWMSIYAVTTYATAILSTKAIAFINSQLAGKFGNYINISSTSNNSTTSMLFAPFKAGSKVVGLVSEAASQLNNMKNGGKPGGGPTPPKPNPRNNPNPRPGPTPPKPNPRNNPRPQPYNPNPNPNPRRTPTPPQLRNNQGSPSPQSSNQNQQSRNNSGAGSPQSSNQNQQSRSNNGSADPQSSGTGSRSGQGGTPPSSIPNSQTRDGSGTSSPQSSASADPTVRPSQQAQDPINPPAAPVSRAVTPSAQSSGSGSGSGGPGNTGDSSAQNPEDGKDQKTKGKKEDKLKNNILDFNNDD